MPLNPWHGGPPTTKSIWPWVLLSLFTSASSSAGFRDNFKISYAWFFGFLRSESSWFSKKVSIASGCNSFTKTVSYPASSRPCESPPHPANRSITVPITVPSIAELLVSISNYRSKVQDRLSEYTSRYWHLSANSVPLSYHWHWQSLTVSDYSVRRRSSV